jgi:plasmid stabilization system protein ParE
MKYKITFRERASREYLDSLLWYKIRSIDAAENFVNAINETLERISVNPTRFRNTYKDFYEVSTKKYPFSVVYFIDEGEKRIVVVSIFHFKRSPKKKFRDNE